MTSVGGFFKTFREAILIADRVKRLTENVKTLALEVRDQDRRLIQIEAFADVAQGRASIARLRDDREPG